MFIGYLLIFALVGITCAKLDLNHEPSMMVESESGLDGTPVSHAGAVVTNGRSAANNLTMPCNNKFCEMMMYAATCKSLNLGMKKVCALHLLGYRYGCDAFPAPAEVVNAPSICIPSALKIVTPLAQNPAGYLASILTPYLNPVDFKADNCDRHCFQNFQYATHDFFSTCRPQLGSKTAIASLMSVFQEYRNQACSSNSKGTNCYASVLSLVNGNSRVGSDVSSDAEVQSTVQEDVEVGADLQDVIESAGTAPLDLSAASALSQELQQALDAMVVSDADERQAAIEAVIPMAVSEEASEEANSRRALQTGANLLNPNCTYYPSPTYNQMFKAGVCATLTPLGCCAATGITMVQQNPIGSLAAIASGGTVNPVVFPACLYKYIEDACPAVDLTNYCTNGSIASNTVTRGTIFVNLTPALRLPNVYTKIGTLTLAGQIAGVMSGLQPVLKAWPYLLTNGLQIQIVDYTYFSDAAGTVALTPSDGTSYNPVGGDYTAALSGQFTYQIVNQDLDATTAAVLTTTLSSANFYGLLSRTISASTATNLVTPRGLSAPVVFAPTPLVFDNAAGSSVSASRGAQGLVTMLLTLGASLLLMKPFGAAV